jgi:predicted CXXCH cytochrome family protein
MKKVLLTAAMVLTAASAFAAAGNITNTKHDLSKNSTSGGTFKDSSEAQICKFCHVPHNANSTKILWARSTGSVTALYANSDSLNAAMPTTGAFNTAGSTSLLCLSCHDGTATLYGTQKLTGTANLTQALSNTHPIGFNYANAQAADGGGLYASLPAATPLFTGNMECASCHAVHDNTNTKFLRMNNDGSNLCKACHQK